MWLLTKFFPQDIEKATSAYLLVVNPLRFGRLYDR